MIGSKSIFGNRRLATDAARAGRWCRCLSNTANLHRESIPHDPSASADRLSTPTMPGCLFLRGGAFPDQSGALT